MSAGQTTENDYIILATAFYTEFKADYHPSFEVFTPKGWTQSTSNTLGYFKTHAQFDHFITKDGLLFLSGGKLDMYQAITNDVAIYDFKTNQLKYLAPMNVKRIFHSCQNIIQNDASNM